MPTLSTKTERNLFRIFVRRLDTSISDFERRLTDYVRTQQAMGRSATQINQELNESLNNGMGIFKDLAGDIEGQIDNALNNTFQAASNEPLKEIAEKVEWVLDPEAEHCDSCLYQESLGARPIDEVPIPGTQPTHGGSNCEVYCKCTLMPAKG